MTSHFKARHTVSHLSSRRTVSRLSSRHALLTSLISLPLLLLTGCFDAEATMTINTDDTVTGAITVLPAEQSRDATLRWQIPTGLKDRVEKTITNSQTGEIELHFQNLGFQETSELISTATDDAVALDIERSGGDQVSISGMADLQAWQGAQINLNVEFPKDTISTNGQVAKDKEGKSVTWVLTSAQRESIWATAHTENKTQNQFFIWLALVSGAGILAAALSALIARRDEIASKPPSPEHNLPSPRTTPTP